MIYKDFQGLKLSALGMGCMRLPTIGGEDAKPDPAAVAEMVDLALDQGVNYFDTAWGYHGGNSEAVLGAALARHPRESFYLADKFPGYDLANMDKVEEIFPEQLRRCGVEYFDFYLFHNVCETNCSQYLNPQYGILDYLLSQKKQGRIRHLGFSCHGSLPTLERFLSQYGEHMEFCQLQLNYIDWDLQGCRKKVELLNSRHIPVWVMEPLRGGRLANVSPEESASLAAIRPGAAPVEIAFRFLQSLPEVTVILSGMSNLDQLRGNLETFQKDAPLTPAERESLLSLAGRMMDGRLPCTACRYCVSHCPQGLDIPELLALYNEQKFSGKGGFLVSMALAALPEEKRPSACVGCRSCEAVCPQQLSISRAMADFASE